MPTPHQHLFAAILEDNHARAKQLLTENPRLALDASETEARYELGIAHWIYVGDSALHIAAAGYRVEIAKLLIAAGAAPNSAMNHRRSRPLHYASDGYLANPFWNPEQQVAMILFLLKAGSALHAQDKNGATPLHRAVRTRCAAAVECILDAGGDATMKNRSGSTPFHLAIQNTGRGGTGAEKAKIAQHRIIQAFLRRGVSVNLKDGKGKSVLQWAKCDAIRQILLKDAD